MFIEPSLGKRESSGRTGWIEVVCGCMFSGKTEELIRRLNRAFIAKQKVEIFKPKTDTRYHEQNIVSHNENAIRSTPVNFASDILLLAGDCDVVGIDEAQFFDESIVEVCNTLANSGKREIVAAWTWISKANLLDPCLIYWLLPNLLQKFMPFVPIRVNLHRSLSDFLKTMIRLCWVNEINMKHAVARVLLKE